MVSFVFPPVRADRAGVQPLPALLGLCKHADNGPSPVTLTHLNAAQRFSHVGVRDQLWTHVEAKGSSMVSGVVYVSR